MKYCKCYDIEHDDLYQCQISDESAAKAPKNVEISDTPFPNIPIKSRFTSERYKDEK